MISFENPNRFIPFSFTHWVILILAIFIVLISPAFKKLSDSSLSKISNFISWGYIAFFPIHLLVYIFLVKTFNIVYDLPILQICGVSSLATSLYLLTRNRNFYLISYFWGFGAMLASFLTPALLEDFPHIYYYLFWGSHLVIITTITFIYNIYPIKVSYKDVWKSFLFFLIYVAIVYPINVIINANYGFVRSIPEGNSFLDIFGPQWSQAPYYYIPAVLIIIGLFHLFYFVPIWYNHITRNTLKSLSK